MKNSEIKKRIRKAVDKIFESLKEIIIMETYISEDNWDRVDVGNLLEPEISKKEKE